MKRTFRAVASVAALAASLSAPLFAQTTFRKYVALGDSLTSSAGDGFLRRSARSLPKGGGSRCGSGSEGGTRRAVERVFASRSPVREQVPGERTRRP